MACFTFASSPPPSTARIWIRIKIFGLDPYLYNKYRHGYETMDKTRIPNVRPNS